MLFTRKPLTDADVQAMQERLEKRRAICRRAMGETYIGHPAQQVQKQAQEVPAAGDDVDSVLAFIWDDARISAQQLATTGLVG